MGGRDLRNVKCTCNCTLDVTALCMHENLDFPVQQFHLYIMLMRKNIRGVHCKWHVMYIHTIQPGNTSKVLSIISRNFFMLAATFWGRSSGLVTSLATSSGVISSRSSSSFEKKSYDRFDVS